MPRLEIAQNDPERRRRVLDWQGHLGEGPAPPEPEFVISK